MKRKGLICGLISCVFACIAMAVSAVKVDTASADTNTVYPFETGVNAFEYGVEVTVPSTEWSVIYYKPYCALQGVAQFQGIQDGGVLALQVSTQESIAIYMTAWDDAAQYGYGWNSAWFMYEDGTIIDVFSNGAGIELPAYASGALIVPTLGFGMSDWSKVTLVMANFHSTYAGRTVELGALGYALDNTLAGMSLLTPLDNQSQWIITGGDFSPIIGTKTETATYPLATDKNAFAYGRTWTITEEMSTWAKVYYTPNGTYALDSKGYLALQIEALTDVAIYPTVWDNAAEVGFMGYAYFVSENGAVDKCLCINGHVQIEQGAKGMLVMPLSGFASSTFNWATTTLFIVNVNADVYGAQSAKLGAVNYYANETAQMQAYTALNETAQIQTNGIGSLEVIEYVQDQVKNDMRKGDNAFAYGAVWSGVQQTQDNAWPKTVVDFDAPVAVDKTNGIIAIQMEISCESGFLFLPSLWDGAGESYLLGSATFISEDGVAVTYENTNGNLYLPAGKGVLVMKMADFDNNTNWNAVTSMIITINSAYAYNFELKLGEVGYYTDVTAAMQKILVLDSVDDFNQYHLYGDGTLAYIMDKELAQTPVLVTFTNEEGETLFTQDVLHYQAVVKPENPTKEVAGYQVSFLGWYYGDAEWDFATTITKPLTLVAKFAVSVIEYTVTFVADNATVGTATYTVENKDITAPAVPAKDGYTGVWETYELTTGDVTVNAVYTAIEYTVTFVADGATVGTATYTVENKDITVPAVPAKDGYTGAWEVYELTTGDVTVNAVYTEIPVEDDETSSSDSTSDDETSTGDSTSEEETSTDSASEDETSTDSTSESVGSSEEKPAESDSALPDDTASSSNSTLPLGCFGSVGGMAIGVAMLGMAVAAVLKKKED